MSGCGQCLFKPFCQDAGAVCSYFKDKENFVEIVRCKDCEYWDNNYRFCKLYGLTADGNSYFWEQSYCSRGVRKE